VTLNETLAMLRREVANRFNVSAESVRIVRAPYRICPLGAHIDHQLGPVTGLALDVGVYLAYAPSGTDETRLQSLDFPGEVQFRVGTVPGPAINDWGNFPRGAVAAIATEHPVHRGLVGLTTGPLKEGGLSSSAAIGVAYLLAFADVNGLTIGREKLVDLDQWIENRYLGLKNGILDQATILLSRANQLTRIDCAARTYSWYAPPPDRPPPAMLLAFSGLTQALVGTDYNRRVAECEAAAAELLSAAGRSVEHAKLGHVTAAEYAAYRHVLDGPSARRAAHFFGECERVEQGLQAWAAGDWVRFGCLMSASGESSIQNYECGAPPLIDLYRVLVSTPGVLGARFSGAGFRGCCVAFVEPDAATAAAEQVARQYAQLQPELAGAATPPLVTCSADAADWV